MAKLFYFYGTTKKGIETMNFLEEKIVKDGFVELTEHNFKHYLDGFTLSFRNGLFYEQKKSRKWQNKIFKN